MKVRIFAMLVCLSVLMLWQLPVAGSGRLERSTTPQRPATSSCSPNNVYHQASAWDGTRYVEAQLWVYSRIDPFGDGCDFEYVLTDFPDGGGSIYMQPMAVRVWVCGSYYGMVSWTPQGQPLPSASLVLNWVYYGACGPQADDYGNKERSTNAGSSYVTPYTSWP